ncbi:hypothetical protein OKA04_09880 [Luteolibacter flavescens]|uniref:Uncharacterized protein n=1 Tax=Luteolibacter flavescens TaxID=1859460 RepID=A0ABT3FN91_9BACT|nr:hypothetical protein [Luteolibacter flavescens]MCW1885035.1 hypothetical protein [Luteolibacter flavescens]
MIATHPPSPGFYWWRSDALDAWQVLEVKADLQEGGALYVRQDYADVYQAGDAPDHPWFGEWVVPAIEPPAVERGAS